MQLFITRGRLASVLSMAVILVFHTGYFISFAASATSSSSSSAAGTNQIVEQTMTYPESLVNLISNDVETKINNSGTILEITSMVSEVNSIPFPNSITAELHGISKDQDTQKRKVAQNILAADTDFQVVFFLMPDGGVYFIEPYSQQQNLTGNNFAFRDYYKRALQTRNTYLSNVIISAASGRPHVNIAVPIYSESSGTLVGVWAGGLNVSMLTKTLKGLKLSEKERIVYVDQQGQKIADSDEESSFPLSPSNTNNTLNESFDSLRSFKNAINGQSGTIAEIINGTNMLIS
ncbi:MAG: cache domain-containing protein [Nitrososphaera sp.]